jgi:hypothetical protein
MENIVQGRFTQGAESNHSGQFLERAIEEEFRRRGVEVFESDPLREMNADWVTECYLMKNAPYTSIYGCQSRSEFLYVDCRLHSNIRIECRWQQASGSVDEKMPYLFMSAVNAMPEVEIWLIIDGGGAREQAVDWLKRECGKVAAKTIRVLSIPEARYRIKNLRV